jgi:hypothetical protein
MSSPPPQPFTRGSEIRQDGSVPSASMASPPRLAPRHLDTLAPAEVARVEHWAATCRAELARLALVRRAALAELERAEAETGDAAPDPNPLIEVIDTQLATRWQRALADVAGVRQEAELVVGVAVRMAEDTLRRATQDPRWLALLEPRAVLQERTIEPPPPAAELWARVQAAHSRPTSTTTVARPAHGVGGNGVAPAGAPVSRASLPPPPNRPASGGDAAGPVGELASRAWPGAATPFPHAPATGSVAQLGPETGSGARPALFAVSETSPALAVGLDDGARAYDAFWARVPNQHPMRVKLRRRAGRGRP